MRIPENSSAHDFCRRLKDFDGCKYRSPQGFYPLTLALAPWFAATALLFCAAGLYLGFLVAPTDTQQGEAYRIIFIHVPAAWMSLLIYLLLALCAGSGLVFNARLASMMASALAPTGAMFAFLTLWSGCLWAKPVWGAWWVWDTRLMSELVLMLLYAGFIALQSMIYSPLIADRAGALLALAGLVDVPINVLSVQWWSTLHQGASVSLTAAPSVTFSMLSGILTMTFGFCMYACAVVLLRLRCEILERERDSGWVAVHPRVAP